MNIKTFVLGDFGANVFLVEDPQTQECALIDTSDTFEVKDVISSLSPSPNLTAILLTHAHVDHAGALTVLQDHFKVQSYLSEADMGLFKGLPDQGTLLGMPHMNRPCGKIDHQLKDGDTIQEGNITFNFLLTPGHTPGQGCYYNDTDIFVGDLLFDSSIGRTDLPMGDPITMKNSLRKLMQLPLHLKVHCGHGEDTTLEKEFFYNPFLGFLRSERGVPEGHAIHW